MESGLEASGWASMRELNRKIITPYFTPFAGVNMPKYAYIMPANENIKGV